MQNESTIAANNQVARLTYGLTGANLLLTTIVAWFAMHNAFLQRLATTVVGLVIVAIVLIIIALTIRKAAVNNPPLGVILWAATSVVFGIFISPALNLAGPKNVITALGMTVGFCAILTIGAFQTKTDMTKFSSQIGMAFVAGIIVEILNALLFHSTGFELIVCGVMLIVLGFDFILNTQRIKNNADSDAPLSMAILIGYGLYLDIINIFMRLLQILSIFSGGNNN